MKKKIGTVDKWIRIVLGLALLALFVWGTGAARWWGLLGLIPLITALLGYCPLYSLLKINTNKQKDK